MVVKVGPGRASKRVANGERARTAVGGTVVRPAVSRTIGWGATCDCMAAMVPSVVLDPFTGSGTAGAVAVSLGQSFVGTEINPEYIALAEGRLAEALGRSGNATPDNAPDGAAVQLGLFAGAKP